MTRTRLLTKLCLLLVALALGLNPAAAERRVLSKHAAPDSLYGKHRGKTAVREKLDDHRTAGQKPTEPAPVASDLPTLTPLLRAPLAALTARRGRAEPAAFQRTVCLLTSRGPPV